MEDSLSKCEFDTDKLLIRLEIEMSAEISSIEPVVHGVMEIAKEMKCAAGKEFEVDLALREALANAVRHGCGGDPTKTIHCTVACDKTRGMLIVISDPGAGFDTNSIPSPTVGQNVFSEHGRGIFLINQLMDEVHYERGGTEIHMMKR